MTGQTCGHKVCQRLSACAYQGRPVVSGDTNTCPTCGTWLQPNIAGMPSHEQVVHGRQPQFSFGSVR